MSATDRNLDDLTETALQAQAGDSTALEHLCSELANPMYRLALRYCGNPNDAEDAAQEVMVRIVTGLGSFRGESRFTTWAYKVAVRQLLRSQKRRTERSIAGPESFTTYLDRFAGDPVPEGEATVAFQELAAEVRLSCTYGMLLCLGRPQRVAYLMGDLLGFTDVEAAEIAGISRAAHRKRVSRARTVMRELMATRCGLVRSENPCRCAKLVEPSVEDGWTNPDQLIFARHDGVTLPLATDTLSQAAAELDIASAMAEVYHDTPAFRSPRSLWAELEGSMPTLLDHTKDP